jgi:hypothetical protein
MAGAIYNDLKFISGKLIIVRNNYKVTGRKLKKIKFIPRYMIISRVRTTSALAWV